MHISAPLMARCLAGAVFILAAGCASVSSPTSQSQPDAAQTAQTEPAPPAPAYADFEPDVLYLLLSAEIAAQRGRYDVTLVNYLKAAQQSRDLGVIERAMQIAQSLHGDNAQTRLAELWLEEQPDSLPAHRIAAIQAVKRGDLATALAHMEAIMNLGEDADFDSLAVMAGSLAPAQQQELLALYKQLAERHPDTPELEYGIALLLKVTGQPKQALARLEPLLDAHDNFQPAIVLKGDLLYETGRKHEALDYMMSNTRRFPDSRQMGTLYGRMLISEGELQAAQDEFARLVQQFPDVPGLRLSHALVAMENDQEELAREELSQLVEQGQHANEAQYYLGRIADEAGDVDTAIDHYQAVEQGSYYFPALSRASALMAARGQLQDALARIQSLRDSHPAQAETYWLLEVNLLLDEGQRQQALASANQALEQYPDNTQIRYARAMLQDALGQPAEAEQDLTRIVQAEPNNAVALNALGYILTTRTDRLNEARDYIERALQLDPDNPAILDSMGWVLFREGQLMPALRYLKQAWEAFPDPEVAAHYGEALWMAGEEEQAQIIWQQGLAQDPDHEILRQTIQRLTGSGRTP
ncbi:tetratricopeptide repeat protein [uncultured Marinobacter sp.]|uniref:tetratricopeptide repeat protein n=1 Tax=uncultured Marinobacter sp. TaxID=187379 RepID=UPI000C090680|nr:hypothetical protein [Marinobacter sp.]MBI42567.1 hypothetical protein [Oceanospirillales bacterium]